MTVHRDFANKSCPGDYLYSLHSKIADEVNKSLGVFHEDKKLYRVQVGSFSIKSNADKLKSKLSKLGYDTIVVIAKVNSRTFYRVQVGAYSVKNNAVNMQNKLKSDGFDSIIVEVNK